MFDWSINVVFCWYFSLPLSVALLVIYIYIMLKKDGFEELTQNKYRTVFVRLGLLFYAFLHSLFYVVYQIMLGY